MKKLVLSFHCSFIGLMAFAQDTLPNFSVKNVGNNRIIVGWTNKLETISQISIQRSFDSLRNFKTIHTIADPKTPQNGYVDMKATNDHMFYRLYIMLEGGTYLFSKSAKPVVDTMKRTAYNDKVDPLVTDGGTVPTIGVTNPVKTDLFKPSMYVYTYRDGFVQVSLPEDAEKKYTVKFFEDDGTPLFDLKDVKERKFKIDKANFYHAGWFRFELYENGELLEKHKFYLQKDF